MTRTPSTPPRCFGRRLAGGLAAALWMLITACGGGGGQEGDGDPAAAPHGRPVTATVGAAGGELAFNASGLAGRLSFPAGALAGDTAITVTPVAPGSDEWARVRIEGPQGVLAGPATLSLQLAEAPPAAAAGVLVEDGGVLPLPTAVGADGRSLEIQVQGFADGAAAAASPAPRMQALAARPRAAAAPPPPVAARRQLTPQERLDALRRSIERHELELSVRTGLSANLAAANLLQMVGGGDDNAAAALREIAQATDKACTQLRVTLLAATGATVPADLNARDENESQRWILRVMGPVLYWQAIVMKLGGDPCQGVDVDSVLSAKFTELLNWVKSKATARQDSTGFGQIVKPLPQAATLAGHARILSAPRLESLLKQNFVEPALVPLRAIAWETAAATQAHYMLVISQLNSLYLGPFKDDVQMLRTSLQVNSADGTGAAAQSLGSGGGGAGATPAQTVSEITVPARKGGQVTVSGPIDVLHCPDAASERLVIDFEGATVLDRPAAGTRLLDGSLSFGIDALLAAANIATSTEATHTLRVRRVGSTCNRTLGLADAELMRIRLDFLAGKAPPPSRIAGKTFSGSSVFYYAPFRHPDCSRICLENNPGADRCRVSPDFDFTLAVSGDAREYTMTIRTRPRNGPGFESVWTERVFKGPGTDHSAGGAIVGATGLVDPSNQTAGLVLDTGTSEVSGAIVGKCTEEEFTAR